LRSRLKLGEKTVLTSSRQVLPFFLPMAASWTFMALEAPVLTFFIARLPNTNVSLAAFGLTATLSFAIETPVIGLLSTSTALSTSKQNFRIVRNFAFWIIALVTVCAALFALTPAYRFVVSDLIGVPHSVEDAARSAMVIMIPWSAGVGFRRYAQGILIRNGVTAPMSWGTVLRISTMALCAALLARSAKVTGAQLAAYAWVAGVWAEAAYNQIVVRAVVRRTHALEHEHSAAQPLTYRAIIAYHFPLTAANMIWLLSRPIFTWALSASSQPELKLAGWEASGQLMFLFRGASFAMPEAALALAEHDPSGRITKRFSLQCGLAMACLQFLAASFQLCWLFYSHVVSIPEETARLAVSILIICSPVPFFACYQGYLKGKLSYLRKTGALTVSVGSFVSTVVVLIAALKILGRVGIEAASIVFVAATVVETWYLHTRLAAESVHELPARSDYPLAEERT